MTLTERSFGVWLYDEHIGTIRQRGDYTWFGFTEPYLANPQRAVLGLAFEEDLHALHANALRLPPWFSNLLPEGQLRNWIARDRGVSVEREMELLAQVGADLPGAVRVFPEESSASGVNDESLAMPTSPTSSEEFESSEWRFSLAGVGLKFSMMRDGDRLTLPVHGQGGDWIVKLPDPLYRDVPRNEHAMMVLAKIAGINVPDNKLVKREDLHMLPSGTWQSSEELAYAVRRFDRDAVHGLVHIEDFAQVRNIYPYGDGKYRGNFDTIGNLTYRGHDTEALREFARRLAFNVLISNGDAHLKNWSLIYRDRRVPTLSPVYDLVSTAIYREDRQAEDLGLKFGGSRRFGQVTLHTFNRLQRRIGANSADLRSYVVDVVEKVVAGWPSVASLLVGNKELQDSIDKSIADRANSLLRV